MVGMLLALLLALGVIGARKMLVQSVTAAPILSNRQAMLRLSLREQANVVFIGDSLTERADWSDITGCSSLANRGVGGETTEEALADIDEALKLKPLAVFVMLGVNDVSLKVPTDTTVANIKELRARVKAAGAVPFIISTLPASKQEAQRIPSELITSINDQISPDIDLRPLLTEDGNLREDMTADGVHLMPHAYAAWRDTLLPTVMKYCLPNTD